MTPNLTRRRLLRVGGGIAGVGVLSRAFIVRPDIPVDRLKAEYATDASQFLDIGGASVHVRDEGPRDAPTLVLIHGFGSSLHTWNGWATRLTDEYRVVRLDLPAFGLTGPNDSGVYDHEYYTSVVDELVDQLEIDRFSLGGNSMGGEVAWRYALDHPEKVEQLVLVDATGYGSQDGDGPLLLTLGQFPVIDLLPRYVLPRYVVRQSLESAWGDPSKLTPALVERYHDLLRRAGNRDAILSMAKTATASRVEELSGIDVPTLVLWGELDTWIPPANADRFVEDISGAELITYPELGHVPNEEGPATTEPDVRAFLRA